MAKFKATWSADITAKDAAEAATVARDLITGRGLKVVNVTNGSRTWQVLITPSDMHIEETT